MEIERSSRARLLGAAVVLIIVARAWTASNLTIFAEAGITMSAYGDVNNDGVKEYVFGTNAYDAGLDPELVVYVPDTTTTYVVKTYANTRQVSNIKIVDFDHDGDNDILFTTSLPARQCFLELNTAFEVVNYGDASPSTTSQISKTWGMDDWDNDGVDEVIATYCSTGNTYIYDGNYAAGFTSNKVDDSGHGKSGEGIITYDVDDDGKQEVFVAYGYNEPPSSETVHIDFLEINTGLTVASRKTILSNYFHSCGVFGGRIGDLDGNGNLEFTIVWMETDRDAYIEQFEFNSSGDIVDSYPIVTTGLDCAHDAARGTTMADYNNDGRDELLVSRVDTSGVLTLIVFSVDLNRVVMYKTLFSRSGYATTNCFSHIDFSGPLNETGVTIGVVDYATPPSQSPLIFVESTRAQK